MFVYSPERRDPVSRTRLLLGDTVESGARWSDEEIRLALLETEVKSFFFVQYDSGADPDATAAVVSIVVGASGMQLVLTVTDGPYDGETVFDLLDDRYDEIEELFDAVAALDAPWSIGLETNGGRISWLSSSVTSWPGRLTSDTDVQIALDSLSIDLALVEAPIDALDEARRLSIWQHKAAARRLLRAALIQEPEIVREGNVTISRGTLEKRLAALSVPVAVGVNL